MSRQETTTRTLYKFDELSLEAQSKALDGMRDINVDFQWWEFTYQDAARIGLKITSFELDRARNATGGFIGTGHECAVLIIAEHGKDCETFKTATRYLASYPAKPEEEHDTYGDWSEARDNWEHEFLQDILEDYSIILQHEYEYNCSDEAVKDTIESNEYEFTEDGVHA